MTLDNFFTLTEMNNGLSAPSRVRELLAVMEKEKNCVTKNAADSTRHLSAVASAIVATENKECFDLFLQLDGLDFIAKWLKDAMKFDDDKICSSVDELIIHLLQALENFGVDHENLLSSGIWATIQNLLVHNNPKVRDKAGALFESWKQKNGTAFIPDVGAITVDIPEKIADRERGMGHSESPPRDGPICRENSVGPKGHESENPDLCASSNSSKIVESAKNSDKSSNLPSGDEGSLDHDSASSLQESRMESPPRSPVKTATEPCVAAVPRQDTLTIIHRDTESSNCTEQHMKIESLPDKAGLLETSKGMGSLKLLGAFLSGTDDIRKVTTPGLHVSENNVANTPDRTAKKSDVEIDYGIVDSLEVARQVDMEVEREVVEYREPSCSSFEKLPECNVQQPNSPESESQKQSHSTSECSRKEAVNDPNSSNELSPMQEESGTSSRNQDAEQTNVAQYMAMPQLTDVAHENSFERKALSKFDLNQVNSSEDPDPFENQFCEPMSFVSASTAASPCQLQEINQDHSTGGSSNNSKQHQGCLDFDLNVAESIDSRVGDTTADEHMQFYPTVPSGESSAETEHLALDLNHSSEDDGTLQDWRIEQLFPQGYQHHDQPLSCMPSKHPARNIDLNYHPALAKDPSVTTSMVSQTLNVFGGVEPDEIAISILGKRCKVNRKTPGSLEERNPEPSFDFNNFFGTNIAPAPPMPFPSTMYGSEGHIPYLVDSIGQSASAAYTQPPLVPNLNTSIGTWRSSFDLNPGLSLESGSKDPLGLGLLLNSGQEQPRPSTQLSMSSVSCGKRREPENGWELDAFRRFTPPWKQI